MFELAFGVVWGSSRELSELRESLAWVEFLELPVEDALQAARIQGELQSLGERIPITDVMIAGIATNRGATLVAAAAHYDLVDGLDVAHHRR